MPDFDSDQADRLRTEPPSSVPLAGEGLVVRGLTKTFGSTIALDHMDAAFARGAVHGLIGENGSGKSTFVKVVAGAHRADLGQVTLDGTAMATGSGASGPDAGKTRVACVYQDGSLIGELTVGQNLELIVGPEFRVGKSWRRALLDDFGLAEVDLGSRVADIPNNEQRLVEIAAALARRPDVALFDESTAALDERGVARVLDSMRSAAAAGVCVIFVTHRLHEVVAVAADITVLRDGRVVGELATSGASTDELVRLMAGREVAAFTRRELPEATTAAPVLRATDLRGRGLGPVQVTVRPGEIVGIGGAAGNGQSELIRALSGAGVTGGEVLVNGVRLRRPEQAVGLGAVFVSGDRRTESLSSLLSIRENYTLAGRAATEHWWTWLPRGREVTETTRLADQFDLARGSIEQPVSSLSGGNQQKVAIGRAIARQPAVLLVEEPTAGVDVRSRLSIYRALIDAARQGAAVIFTSSDASELRMLADRVLILARGRQVAELAGEQVTEEAIVHAFSTAADRRETVPAADGRPPWRRLVPLRQLTWSPATFALVIVLLLALGGYATGKNGDFATMGNVGSILQLALPLTLVAIAQMPVLLAGEIDASLGSMMGLIVVLLSFQPHTSVPVLCLIAAGAGIGCGLINAVLVIGFRINSVIATIATLGAFLGIGEILRPTPAGTISLQLSTAVDKAVAQIPYVFIAVVVLALAIDIYINASRTGLRARAVGYSAERATQLGVRSRAFKAAMFVVAGLITGLAGVVLAAQTGVGDPSVGSTYTLLSLAVPVIGGAILAGGRGSALGCVLGALFVAEVEDFVPFINLPNGGYLIAVGALTVLALIVGSWRSGPSVASAMSRIVSLRKLGSSMADLIGKVALVTGAARGQGRAHALALAAAGADIIATDICKPIASAPYDLATPDDLAQTVAAVEKLDRRVVSMECDIRSSAALDAAVRAGLDQFGKIDILIANAGIWALGRLWELTDEQWQDVLDTNLTGTWRSVKAVVPAMIENGGGSIVLTSSVNGFEAGAGMTHYVAAKHGVLGLMRNAALELGPYNIRCNAVCPGIVDTKMNDWQGAYDMMAGAPGGTAEDRQHAAYNWSALAGRGLLNPASIAKAALWLASDDAADVTGVVLPVDGGHAILPGINPAPVRGLRAVRR